MLAQNEKNQKKKSGWFKKILIGYLGLMVVGLVIMRVADKTTPEERQKKEAQRSEEQSKDNKRILYAAAAISGLQSGLREPDSLQVDSIMVDENAMVACIEYRAKNGFGGVNKDSITIKDGKPFKDAGTWNKNCTKSLYDVTDGAKKLIRLAS